MTVTLTDPDDFLEVIEEVIEQLPDRFRRAARSAFIEVQDQPDADTVRRLGLPGRRSLLGLYTGVPNTERTIHASGTLPDRIILYHKNILGICRTDQEVIEQIRITLLHEVGHLLGMDDDELRALGY